MEELLAYAYLLGMDLISETIYEEKLNELFLENPTDEDLLELEFLSGKTEETIIYIRTHINCNSIDFDRFGRVLFGLLKPIYESMDIHGFGNVMYSLWENLAGNLQDMEPFWTLSYADEKGQLHFTENITNYRKQIVDEAFFIMGEPYNEWNKRGITIWNFKGNI